MKHIFIINPKAGRSNARETLIPCIHQAQQVLSADVEILARLMEGV